MYGADGTDGDFCRGIPDCRDLLSVDEIPEFNGQVHGADRAAGGGIAETEVTFESS